MIVLTLSPHVEKFQSDRLYQAWVAYVREEIDEAAGFQVTVGGAGLRRGREP